MLKFLKSLFKKIIDKEEPLKKVDKDDESDQLALSGSMSGQNSTNDEKENIKVESMESDQINEIMDKILSTDIVEASLTKNFAPYYALRSEKKIVWLYSVNRNSYYPINNNLEIILLAEMDENNTFCMIGDDTYKVANNLIHCIGWN